MKKNDELQQLKLYLAITKVISTTLVLGLTIVGIFFGKDGYTYLGGFLFVSFVMVMLGIQL